MTKKDFILIARAIKRAKDTGQADAITDAQANWLAEVFCAELRAINSRFDEVRFKNAITQ